MLFSLVENIFYISDPKNTHRAIAILCVKLKNVTTTKVLALLAVQGNAEYIYYGFQTANSKGILLS